MLNCLAVILIDCYRPFFAFIHCMLHTPLLLTPADPKKGKNRHVTQRDEYSVKSDKQRYCETCNGIRIRAKKGKAGRQCHLNKFL